MYIPMPSPRGTNRAGLFIPASRFGLVHKAAYDARHGLARDAESNEESGHPAHEVMRRARASLRTSECEQLRALLGKLLMAEREDEDDDGSEQEADGRSRTPDAGRMSTDEPPPFSGRPRPGGEVDPIVKRAQDAAWQYFLAYDATAKRRKKEQLAAATDMALIELPRDLSVRYAAPQPRIATDERADRDFAARCPEVARIRII
jgi:hypothetical protein